jgi:hypothetical protein
MGTLGPALLILIGAAVLLALSLFRLLGALDDATDLARLEARRSAAVTARALREGLEHPEFLDVVPPGCDSKSPTAASSFLPT